MVGRHLNALLPGIFTPMHGDQLWPATVDNDARNAADRGHAVEREYFLIRISARAVGCPYGIRMQIQIGDVLQYLILNTVW